MELANSVKEKHRGHVYGKEGFDFLTAFTAWSFPARSDKRLTREVQRRGSRPVPSSQAPRSTRSLSSWKSFRRKELTFRKVTI